MATLVATALVCAAGWALFGRPFSRAQHLPPRPAITQAEGPPCRSGAPQRFRYPALGVDAEVEKIGVDTSAPPSADGGRPLGNPTDRRRIGWYSAGPQPGSGSGTVLLDGHTYRNGSAVFREDFAERAKAGQVVQTIQPDGSVCSYRVERVWVTIDAAHDYPKLVADENLYATGGPERLFLATCGGRFDDDRQEYDEINVLLAVPLHG